jgi:uncharacterized membrane protein YqjE
MKQKILIGAKILLIFLMLWMAHRYLQRGLTFPFLLNGAAACIWGVAVVHELLKLSANHDKRDENIGKDQNRHQ